MVINMSDLCCKELFSRASGVLKNVEKYTAFNERQQKKEQNFLKNEWKLTAMCGVFSAVVLLASIIYSVMYPARTVYSLIIAGGGMVIAFLCAVAISATVCGGKAGITDFIKKTAGVRTFFSAVVFSVIAVFIAVGFYKLLPDYLCISYVALLFVDGIGVLFATRVYASEKGMAEKAIEKNEHNFNKYISERSFILTKYCEIVPDRSLWNQSAAAALAELAGDGDFDFENAKGMLPESVFTDPESTTAGLINKLTDKAPVVHGNGQSEDE